ncbi:MAG: thiamine phosphate synthase [Solirubrobacteraceae bacterium MAG38_C4-C5]|nr:thiamine phosphate synthase [Candidatus Siliceabacter maunaloa]
MTSDRHARLLAARLYFVAGARPGGRPLAEVLRPALRGGVDLFQLREKDAGDEAVVAAAREARALCDEAGALFILNDRPELVDAAGADGVHVGQDDMPVAQARAILGAQRIVGWSTHEPAQLAAVGGADYVAVGPVHATPTKPGRPATGAAYVRHAAANEPGVPWFAIGGIDEHTVGEVVAAGARRIVVVRAIAEAADPERAARTLRAALEQGALRGAA